MGEEEAEQCFQNSTAQSPRSWRRPCGYFWLRTGELSASYHRGTETPLPALSAPAVPRGRWRRAEPHQEDADAESPFPQPAGTRSCSNEATFSGFMSVASMTRRGGRPRTQGETPAGLFPACPLRALPGAAEEGCGSTRHCALLFHGPGVHAAAFLPGPPHRSAARHLSHPVLPVTDPSRASAAGCPSWGWPCLSPPGAVITTGWEIPAWLLRHCYCPYLSLKEETQSLCVIYGFLRMFW